MPLLSSTARRALGVGCVAIVFVMLAGATYQGVATALERREYPRPGGLVSVGDHQLHIYCTGHGSPVVVLEAPAAGLSAAWRAIQDRLSPKTRICSYDRAGLGWSESGDRPFDPGRVPEELHSLLVHANERGPFVVAGQGLGAAFARLYAARPDSNAVALVMIDPPFGGSTELTPNWIMPVSAWLARSGVLRAGRILSSKADGLQRSSALHAFLNRPDHLTRAAAEIMKWDETVQRAAAVEPAATTKVVTVELGARDRISFLTTPTAVDEVVRAIDVAVTTARTN